jgi:uncharacterized membrane protein YeaQ/YmgE (transglycosylase-associated protein family)
MQATSILAVFVIGAIAGWLAGLLTKGGGFGLFGNIVVGIVGAVIGGALFSILGISADGPVGSIIMATLGAGVLLFLVSLVKEG